VRDEHGVFRAASPAGTDPAVAADVETFEKGIEGGRTTKASPQALRWLKLVAHAPGYLAKAT
jgi:hypothetical protein